MTVVSSQPTMKPRFVSVKVYAKVCVELVPLPKIPFPDRLVVRGAGVETAVPVPTARMRAARSLGPGVGCGIGAGIALATVASSSVAAVNMEANITTVV
jgi:hypothetical protein